MAGQSKDDGHSVAITGLSCRFPGDGDTLDHFWESICHGQSAWSEIPKSRFNVDAFHSTSGNVNTSTTRGAHFLKQDITKFDANFFGLSKVEAGSMDPQHRMMLEVAYQSLENAGLSLKDVAGSKTGVFIGHFTSDYRETVFRDPESAPTYTFSGTTKTSLANRISWLFDLQGPSFSLDTACSSSLVALHLACQSLRTGESDTAIVGGVNLLLNPEMFLYMSNQHFLSPDGKCKSFDESGDGYGRGEGIAALVLRRVDDAIARKDPVRAVIRGTGSNQDGHTKGFTLPSAQAQARLINDTYRAAGLDFRDTRYIEAHGTGTQAGDTEETLALSETVSKERSSNDPLYIGSVKSNIGHLEACAGLAGVIKSMLILQHGMIPPTVHFKKGNPKIKFQEWGLEVPITLTPWPASGLRRISINSFGYGGTNAHAIFDDAYHYLQSRGAQESHCTETSAQKKEPARLMNGSFINGHPSSPVNTRFAEYTNGKPRLETNGSIKPTSNGTSYNRDNDGLNRVSNGYVNGGPKPYTNGYVNGEEKPQKQFSDLYPEVMTRLFMFSAQDKEGLKRTKNALADYLLSKLEDESLNSPQYLANLSFTLSRRATLQWRTYITASSIQQLCEKLQNDENEIITRASDDPRIGFVFTGQGAQWPMMGMELMVSHAFRESVQAADEYLRVACSCTWSVKEELTKGKFSSRLHLAEFSQTLCTVLQVAIVDLLRTWRIIPMAVAGHSSGEIAAAYCIGALSREDAWRAAHYRGVVSSTLKNVAPELSGSMMAVGASPKQAEIWASQAEKGEVVVACVNSPSSVTLSGDTAGIDEIAAKLAEIEVFARKLKVDTAYHSPHMQIVAQDYLEHVGDIRAKSQTGSCRMHSSVTGRQIQPSELGAANWVRNLTSPVQFAAAIHDMVQPVQDNSKGFEVTAVDLLIEIGPHSALQGPCTQTLKTCGIKDMPYETVLQRDNDGLNTALALAGAVSARGGQLDILAVNNENGKEKIQLLVDLPSYSWNHSQSYWEESRLAREFRNRKEPPTSLLGAPSSPFGQGEYMWRKYIRLAEEPWIADHQIESSIVYPGAGFLAMAFEAAQQIADPHQKVAGFQLRDVQISAAVVISDDVDVECMVQIRPHFTSTRDSASTWMEFVITTSPDAETLQRNCSGLLVIEYESAKDSSLNNERLMEADQMHAQYLEAASSCKRHIAAEQFYHDLDQIGLRYGPLFRNLRDIRSGKGKSSAAVDIPKTNAKAMSATGHRPHIIHPGTLDAMFHSAFVALLGIQGDMKQAMVPRAIEGVYVSADIPYRPENRLRGFSNAEKHGFKELKADIIMFAEETTHPVVNIVGFTCMEIGSSSSASEDNVTTKSLCSKLTWRPAIQLLSTEETKRAIMDACEVDGEDCFVEGAARDEANAIRCLHVSSVAADQVPSAKKHFWEWIQAQKLTETPDHRSPTSLDHIDPSARNKTDRDQIEKLSLALQAQLLSDQSDSDVAFTASRADLYLESAAIKSLLKQLVEYLRLFHFTKPGLSILELATGSLHFGSFSLMRHLPGFEAMLDTAQYNVAFPNADVLTEAQKSPLDLNSDVEYVVFDAEKSVETQVMRDQKFDVILAFDPANAMEHPHTALRNVQKLLKEDGNVCVIDISNPGLYLSMLTESGGSGIRSSIPMLAQNGLDVHLTLGNVDEPQFRQAELLIARAAVSPGTNQASQEVMIIRPADLSARAQAASQYLSEALARQSYATSDFIWGSDTSSLDGKDCISLLELDQSLLSDLSERNFGLLKQVIARAKRTFWVVGFDGPSSGMINGLARAVRNEIPGTSFQIAHTDIASTSSFERFSSAIVRVFRSSTSDDEFRIQDGMVNISRIEEDVVANEQVQALMPNAPDVIDTVPLGETGVPLKLCVQTPGMLDSLSFEADDLPLTELEANEIEIDMKATALNFRDIMVVMGQIPDRLLGFDAAGIVRRVGSEVSKFKIGDSVAMCSHGSHRTIHRSKEGFCALIPDGLSFEQAATIPVVHGTAWYGLVQLARVEKGQSILIHAAAGGVGQSAIQIAQYFEMNIIATVGSEPKRKLLRETYGLSDDQILSSRDLSFVKGVKRLTGGRGVDVILNSLSGEFLRQTWHCIAPFGTFVEIGIKDILDNTELDMRPFLQSASYTLFNLNRFERERPDIMSKIIAGTFEFQRRKITRPITPVKVYPVSEVENAFRLMQAGKHLGKVVLSFTDSDRIPVIRRSVEPLRLEPNAAYVIVGGFGGLGRSISYLLVDQGARKLCFLSRSGGSSTEAQKLIQDLRSRRVEVQAYRCNITDPVATSQSISNCLMELGPIRGVIQCAMVLRDVLFMNMSYDEWTEAVKPKVQGTWNIHQNLKDLDFFVCLSSFAATFGNRGQSNYAAAGAYQDSIAYHRRSLGLHGVTLDVGIMRDVGVLAEKGMTDSLREWEKSYGILESELHALLKRIIAGDMKGDMAPQLLTGFATGGSALAAGIATPFYLQDDARFSIMARTGVRAQQFGSNDASRNAAMSTQALLTNAGSAQEATQVVTDALVRRVAKMLQTPESEIDTGRFLHAYGVDSLTAIEIVNWVLRELKATMSVIDIMASVPMTTTARKIVSSSALYQGSSG